MKKFLQNLALVAMMILPLVMNAQVTIFPYSSDFEDDIENDEWTLVNGSQTNKWYIGTAANNGGTKGLYVSNDNGTTNAYSTSSTSSVYAYRTLTLSAGSTYSLSFDWRCYGESTWDVLRVWLVPASTTLSNSASYRTANIAGDVIGSEKLNLSGSWNTYSNANITVGTDGDYNLVFYWYNDASSGTMPPAGIDNVVFSEVVCPFSATATASNITSTSADLDWTAGTETGWNIVVSATALSMSDLETAVSTPLSTNSYSALGLVPNTEYHVYLQGDCGNGDLSLWNHSTFRTACAEMTITSSDIYNEGFESYTSATVPSCWEQVSTYSNRPYVYSSYAHTGSNCLYFYSSSSSPNLMASPVFDNLTSCRLRFWARYYSSNPTLFEVGVLESDNTFTALDTITLSSTYNRYECTFDQYTGTGNRFAFKSSGSYTYACVDDIVLDLIPTCLSPVDLTAHDSLITSTSAEIGWTSRGAEAQWNVVVTRNLGNPDTMMAEVASTNPFTVTGLDANTPYYVYVQASCSADDQSEWSDPISFRSGCDAMDNVELETFESFSSNTLPFCWQRVESYTSGTTTYPGVYSSSTYAHNGSRSMRLYTYATANKVASSVASPALNNIADLRVRFYARAESSSTTPQYFTVGVLEDDNTITPVDTIALTTTYSADPFEVRFNEYTGTGNRVVFRSYMPVNTSTVYIDDVVIDEIPSCFNVTNVHVDPTTLTATSADIEWTPGDNEAAWNIIISDTAVVDFDAWTPEVATINTFNATLNSNTTYYVYVQAVCNEFESSEWSLPATFHTALAAPFTEGFEGITYGVPAGWSVGGTASSYTLWSADITTYANYGATHSGSRALGFNIYSADEGTTAILYTPAFALDGDYTLSFWASNASSNAITVAISTDNGVSYTNLTTVPAGSGPWTEYTADLFSYSGNNVIVSWTLVSDYEYDNAFLDDISVMAPAACPNPTGLAITGNSSSSITLAINDTVASAWELAYGPAGAAVDTLPTQTVTETTVTVDDLTSGETYAFYVRANCGDSYSNWYGPVNATPGLFVARVTGVDTIRACDLRVVDNGGLTGDYGSSCNYTLVIYPSSEDSIVSLTGTYDMEDGYDYLEIYDGVGTGNMLYELSGTGSFNAVSSNGAITIRVSSDGSVEQSGFDFHVSCEAAPDCATPYNVVATNVTGTSATITWTPGNSTQDSWIIVVDSTANLDTTAGVTVYDNSYDLTDLEPNTVYYVLVQATCGSDWTQLYSFRTPCASLSLPFYENFDALTSVPNCWSFVYCNYSGIYFPQISTSYAPNSTNALRFRGSASYSDQSIAILPAFEGSLNGVTLAFDYKHESASYGQFSVGYMLNGTFTSVQSLTPTSTPTHANVVFDTVPENARLAIRFFNDYSFYDGSVDNIEVLAPTSCPAPVSLSAYLSDNQSLAIHINDTSYNASWQIGYGVDGTALDSLTLVDVYDVDYQLTGLNDSTLYVMYARADCGDGTYSNWTSPTKAMPGLYFMGLTGSDTLTTCSGRITDDGGLDGNYSPNVDYTLVVFPGSTDSVVRVTGTMDGYDYSSYPSYSSYIEIYGGVGTSGNLLATVYDGAIDTVSPVGPITIRLHTTTYNYTTYIQPGLDLRVSCEEAPGCPDVYGLAVDHITGANAQLHWNWTSLTSSATYNVTVVDTATHTEFLSTTTDTTFYQLTGMNQNTGYMVLVSANCDNGNYSESDTTYFTTKCYVGGDLQIGGTELINYNLPFTPNYKYGISQQVYDAAELSSDTIYGIAFYAASSNSLGRNLTIYMDTTSRSTFSSTGDFRTPDTTTRVFSVASHVFTEGWNEFTFATPYVHTPGMNLLLTVDNNTGSYSYFGFASHATNGSKAVYGYSDNGHSTTPAGYSSYSITTSRTSVKFFSPCANVSCVPPQIMGAEAAVNSATISWIPGLDETAWKVEYRADNDTAWTIAEQSTSQTEATINGLTGNTVYLVRVTSLCSTSEVSSFVSVTTECDNYVITMDNEFYEDFSGDLHQLNCWTVEHLAGASNYTDGGWFSLYNYSIGSGQAQPYLVAGYEPTGSRNLLTLTPFALEENKPYEFSLAAYRNVPSDYATEGVNVYVNTENTLTGATNLGFISHSYSTPSTINANIIGAEAASGWYRYALPFTSDTAGVYYVMIEYVGASSYYDYYLDDIRLRRLSSCAGAQDIEVANVTTSTATISFGDTNMIGDYTLYYGYANDLHQAIDSVNFTSAPYTLTGLTTDTTYFAWLRVNCTEEPSLWQAIPAFTTNCEATVVTVDAPYRYNFYGMEFPECWRVDGAWRMLNVAGNTGNYHAAVNTVGTGRMVLCPFDFTALDTLAQLTFFLKQPVSVNGQDSLVLYYKAADTLTTWTRLASYRTAVDDWTKQEVVLPNSMNATTYQIAFVGYGVNSNAATRVDDITVGRMVTCEAPTYVTCNGYTETTINLAWLGTASSYRVGYRADGDTAWTYTTTTSAPYTLTGLVGGTRYEIAVQSVCGDEYSMLDGTLSVTTPCGIQTIPYVENFDSYTSGLRTAAAWPAEYPNVAEPHCWILTGMAQDANDYPRAAVANYNAYTIDSSNYFNVALGNNLYVVLPQFAVALDSLQINFDYSNGGSAVLGLMTNPNDPQSFMSLEVLSYGDNALQHRFYLDNNINDTVTYHVAIRVSGNDGYNFSMDNLVVDYLPTCLEPLDMDVTNVTATSADFVWAHSATNFEISYRANGTTTWTSVLATGTTGTITGLTPITSYQARVRAICSVGDTSGWSNVVSFMTGCVAIDLPYSEDFETYTGTDYSVAGSMPPCWDAYSNGSSSSYVPHVTSGSGSYSYHNGNSSIVMTSGSTNYGDTKVVILPEFTTPVNNSQLTYWVRTESSISGTLSVGYVTGDASTFVAVKTVPASSATMSGMYDTLALDTVPAAATRIAFKWYYNTSYYTACIDDITVVALGPVVPPCNAPDSLNVVATTNAATMTWVGEGSEYEVSYRDASSNIWSAPVTVNATSYIFGNLTHMTQYEARVRTVCDDTTSVWASTFFTTDTAFWTVTVNTSDATMGTVSGSGRYVEGSTVTISATANDGYHFVRWTDGNTQATRTITVTGDLSYTATFASDQAAQYTITATSNDPNMGTVTGGGVYEEGTTVTLTATANTGYRFVQWQDGVTDATRTITVTGNASYTAYFEQVEGIDDVTADLNINIYPNPAKGNTSISVAGAEGKVMIAVVDMNGRVVMSDSMECSGDCVKTLNIDGLAQGAYFVRVNSANVNMVKKLIVK